MDKAESLMQEYPKDALALLDSLKQHTMTSKAENARFALLYSQVLDKNYIDVTDDSLICIAENWYSKKGNVREKFLSHYYKGVVNSNAKKFPEAITAFSRAQKLEQNVNDSYLVGLLYNQIGHIHNAHYEYTKSLAAFSKASDLYNQAGMTNHRNYMHLCIANCYWNLGNYSNSEKYYKLAISEGKKTGSRVLIEPCVINLIGQYVEQQRYTDAQQLNDEFNIEITQNHPKYAGNVARLQFFSGDEQSWGKTLNDAWNFAKSEDDSIALYLHEYYIYKHLGYLEPAIEALANADELKTKSVSSKLQQPVLETQKQLLEKDLEYNTYKLETDRKIVILTGILLTFLVCITISFLSGRLKKKEKKLASYLCLLAELQNTMQHMQDMLQLKDALLNSAHAETADIINNRLNLINNLSITLYERRGTPKAKEIFIREVEKIINDFKTSEGDLRWMEQTINSSRNNLLERIYTDYPALSKDEKKLLCYIYAGFSPKAISVFLNIPIETVYNRKSRLLTKTGLTKTKY